MKEAAQSAQLPILVVEDEPSVMSFVRAALERKGYRVVPAQSGVEALELLKLYEYLGVISDMRTPGDVDGADVHAWISANRPHLVKKIMFITGDIVNQDTAATLRRTGAPVVEKPFRVRDFLGVVETIFGKP